MLAVDCETIAMTPLVAPPLVCAAFSDGRLLNRADSIDAFREALRDPITNTNIVFDLAVFCVASPNLLPLVFDSLGRGDISSVDINEALDAIAKGHLYRDPVTGAETHYSQVYLEKRYLALDRSAEKESGGRLRYGELAHLPISEYPEEARSYPLADARNASLIQDAQDGHENISARPEWMRIAWGKYLERCWGVRTDGKATAELRAVVTKLHEETLAWGTAQGIYRGPGQKNPKTKSGREYPQSQWGTENKAVVKAMVLKAYKGEAPLADKGDISTSFDTLAESGDPVLEEFAERRGNEKLFSTYLKVLDLGVKQPIHTKITYLVRTGRPSSAQPNLYNLPRDKRVRNAFVPRDGWLYADADYSAVEFCVLAQEQMDMVGRSAMADAINNELDPHRLYAARFMGLSYELVIHHPMYDSVRQIMKIWNYGKGGAMGGLSMVFQARGYGLRLCVAAGVAQSCKGERVTSWGPRQITPTCIDCINVAMSVDKEYLPQWPEMSDYFAVVRREIKPNPEDYYRGTGQVRGYAITRGWNDEPGAYNSACNFRFQHRAAVGAGRALWQIQRECWTVRNSPLFGCRPVVSPYDQNLVEVPDNPRAPDAAQRLGEIMQREMQQVCPDVLITVKPKLTKRWEK